MLLNTTESAENGSEMQKRVYKSEMVQDTTKDKCMPTAAAKASSNLSSGEYRQSFRIKRRAFRLVHMMVGFLLVIRIAHFAV